MCIRDSLYGQEYGIGTLRQEEIEIATEKGTITVKKAAELWGNPDFQVERGIEFKGQLNAIRFLQPLLDRKPYVKKDVYKRQV